jgi:hypothetical protein
MKDKQFILASIITLRGMEKQAVRHYVKDDFKSKTNKLISKIKDVES